MTPPDPGPVVLFTLAEEVSDAVCASAAALGLPCEVVGSVEALAARWVGARAVLVGGDVAARVASAAPRRRPRVYLVGTEAEALARWSVPLGAEVLPLPQGLGWLGGALGVGEGAGALVAVVGGSGGVGASSLAAGLAVAAARRGVGTALVDLDPVGGGVDLLLGAERVPGWRWPRFAGARGEVSDVRDVVPSVAGVTLVASARRPGESAGPEAVDAVVRGLRRHHRFVVLDAGRGVGEGVPAQVRLATSTLVVVPADVRGVAAASQVLGQLAPEGALAVVRRRPGSFLAPVLVSDAVGLGLAGVLPHDRGVVRSGATGEPLLRAGSRWGRAVGRLLGRVEGASDGR